PAELSVGAAVRSDVDDDGAGSNPFAAHEARLTGSRDDDVGAADLTAEIGRTRVTHRHRRVTLQQHQRERLPDQDAAADHEGTRTLEPDLRLVEEAHDTE